MKKTTLTILVMLFTILGFSQTTFNYTGSVQTYTVPPGVTEINIEAYGAQGADHGNSSGGLGGLMSGDLSVTPGEILFIYVGGQYGFNGGGAAGGAGDDSAGVIGGGASDVRQTGTAFTDRIIVGGGGGGAGRGTCDNNDGGGGGYPGGLGGTSSNEAANTGGTGTATSGGDSGVGSCSGDCACSPGGGGGGGDDGGGAGGNYGVFGGTNAVGGTAGACGQGGVAFDGSGGLNTAGNGGCFGLGGDGGISTTGGGGGGGGWYGGGAGGGNWGAGGGGGSSYTLLGVPNLAFTNNTRSGDGEVTITPLCAALIITTTPGDNVCPGTMVTITGTSTTGASITWNNGIANGVAFAATTTTTYTSSSTAPADCITTVTITVEDLIPPTITCAASITQNNDTGICGAAVTYTTPAGMDNCSSTTTQTAGLASGATFPVGTTTNTFLVTDGAGLTATCSFDVTVEDNEGPIIACSMDVTANTDLGVCGAAVIFADAIALDNCGVASVSQTTGLPSGSIFPVGVSSIEYTATDINGNVSACSFTITVTDNELAMAVCQDITIQLDANGDAMIVVADVDGGSTDNCGVASIAVDMDTFDCSNVGSNNVTLEVTDVNGTVSTCIAVVTVEDVTMPDVICQDITVQLDATGTITILGSDVGGGSTDACGIASYDLDMDTFDCSNIGTINVVLTVTDVNGNAATCTAVVTVEDTTIPELVCMDITLELGADGTAMIAPADVSTATDACGINTTAVDIENFDCNDIGTSVTVMVFAIDNNGNLASCNAVVTVVDALAPVVTCPANQTVDPGIGNLFYEVPDYFALGEATATDNCTDPLIIFSQDPTVGTLLPDGVYTITMMAEDEYGNIGECTFELIVESVLGVTDNELNFESVVLYPNPAKEFVILGNPQLLALQQAAIYDLTGRLIQTIDLNNMGTVKTINVSLLATAAYTVVIQTEKGQITKQLLKK